MNNSKTSKSAVMYGALPPHCVSLPLEINSLKLVNLTVGANEFPLQPHEINGYSNVIHDKCRFSVYKHGYWFAKAQRHFSLVELSTASNKSI